MKEAKLDERNWLAFKRMHETQYNPQNLIMINGAFYLIGQCLHFQITISNEVERNMSLVLYKS